MVLKFLELGFTKPAAYRGEVSASSPPRPPASASAWR